MRQGDTAPVLHLQCGDKGAPVDISAATSVEIVGSLPSRLRSIVVTAPFPTDGKLTWVWELEDTEEPGKAYFTVEVTWGDGSKQTFPAQGAAEVTILKDRS